MARQFPLRIKQIYMVNGFLLFSLFLFIFVFVFVLRFKNLTEMYEITEIKRVITPN